MSVYAHKRRKNIYGRAYSHKQGFLNLNVRKKIGIENTEQ